MQVNSLRVLGRMSEKLSAHDSTYLTVHECVGVSLNEYLSCLKSSLAMSHQYLMSNNLSDELMCPFVYSPSTRCLCRFVQSLVLSRVLGS